MNAVDLASLLCSRLCHDLMSPVGALNNGIELLADETDPEMREKCLELLADSARASANKLKFFRLAFGAAGGFGDQVDVMEAQTALEGVFGPERRIELVWMVAGGLVWSLARKFLRSHADAEDAVQEIFVDVWRSAARFDPAIASETTFVAMIARRRLIDR